MNIETFYNIYNNCIVCNAPLQKKVEFSAAENSIFQGTVSYVYNDITDSFNILKQKSIFFDQKLLSFPHSFYTIETVFNLLYQIDITFYKSCENSIDHAFAYYSNIYFEPITDINLNIETLALIKQNTTSYVSLAYTPYNQFKYRIYNLYSENITEIESHNINKLPSLIRLPLIPITKWNTNNINNFEQQLNMYLLLK